MDALHVADGSKVADIGAGAGWFTIRLARRVGPNGMVYAQDVQREMLEAIKRRVIREGLQNVRPVSAGRSDPNLPAATLDAVSSSTPTRRSKSRVDASRRTSPRRSSRMG